MMVKRVSPVIVAALCTWSIRELTEKLLAKSLANTQPLGTYRALHDYLITSTLI